jgi:hypothetical protein
MGSALIWRELARGEGRKGAWGEGHDVGGRTRDQSQRRSQKSEVRSQNSQFPFLAQQTAREMGHPYPARFQGFNGSKRSNSYTCCHR